MTPCPQAQRLFETGTIDASHCESCRELAAELELREADLAQGIDAVARGGDLEAALAKALVDAPQGAQRMWGWDRTFHGALVAAAVLGVLIFWGFTQLGAPGGAVPDLPSAESPAVPVAPEPEPEGPSREELLGKADQGPREWRAEAHRNRDAVRAMQKEVKEGAALDDRAMFALLVECGRAAENAGDGAPPFYDLTARGSKRVVNACWFRAASMRLDDPGLTADNPVASEVIGEYLKLLEDGEESPWDGI